MFNRLLAAALAIAALARAGGAYRYDQFSMCPTPEGEKRRSSGGTNMRAIRVSKKQKAKKRWKQQSKASKNRR